MGGKSAVISAPTWDKFKSIFYARMNRIYEKCSTKFLITVYVFGYLVFTEK